MADDNSAKGPSLKAKSKSYHLRKQAKEAPKETSKASQRDALRLHRALEKEFDRRSRETQPVFPAPPSAPSTSRHPPPPDCSSLSRRSPSQGHQVPGPTTRRTPEATFTPMAAGLRHEEVATVEIPAHMQAWMERAIRQGIAEGLQQMSRSGPPSMAPEHDSPSVRSSPRSDPTLGQVPLQEGSPLPERDLEEAMEDLDRFGEEEELEWGSTHQGEPLSEIDPMEGDMSEDEGLTPDQPTFVGLFKPHMFKSLLFKARNISGLSVQSSSALPSPAEGQEDAIFRQPVVEAEVIPAPPIFHDLVSNQLDSTRAPPAPSSQDRRFFNLESSFCNLLNTPEVDEPIVGLASSSSPSDPLEVLKPEDKRSELALRRAHQADTWAIRSATAASFFTRSSIRWLRQLRQHVPPSNTRAHQDIAKLTAAAEFSADATYHAVKFSARAISSHVTARRLLWLKHWQADVKNKVKLATAPIKGDKLFGTVLEPFLSETRSKKKFLPPLFRRSESRAQPFRRGSSRPFYQFPFPPRYPRPPSFRPFQPQDRADPGDRSRRGGSYRRPFRGSGGKPFRRNR